MRLANHGLTMTEIAEDLELPPGLADQFYNRDYYGTVNHNAKAVYQRYLGWFDGNPAHLHPLPPVEAARRYVDYMGGADAVLAKARASFDEGDYRWVAEVVNHVVFAEPDNAEARALQADTLEQLGYQSESGPWRGFYLTGAQELRHGTLRGLGGGQGGLGSGDLIRALSVELLLDYLAVRLDGPAAAAHDLVFDLQVTDRDETWCVTVRHGVLHARPSRAAAPVRIALELVAVLDLADERLDLDDAVATQVVQVTGDPAPVRTFFGLLDRFEFWFDIVTP
jgi:alkyl sulfatase BDS1-like metallo-beta-lactamase superfamily hydrolase